MRRVVVLVALTLLVSSKGVRGVHIVNCRYLIGAVPHQIAHIHPGTDSKTHRRVLTLRREY